MCVCYGPRCLRHAVLTVQNSALEGLSHSSLRHFAHTFVPRSMNMQIHVCEASQSKIVIQTDGTLLSQALVGVVRVRSLGEWLA